MSFFLTLPFIVLELFWWRIPDLVKEGKMRGSSACATEHTTHRITLSFFD